LRGRTIAIKARFSDFHTITRTKTIAAPTNLAPRIYATARELLDRVPLRPLRLLGLSLSGLSDVRTPVQESLFSDEPRVDAPNAETTLREKKLQRAAAGMDALRKKFGDRTVLPASLLGRG
jgi:DNA polymerase-4